MKILYIVNDSCFYRKLCWFSVCSLRYYNKSIEIEILYICDNGINNRHIANFNDFDLGIPHFDREMFLEAMSEFNVTFRFVYNCDLGEETGYPNAQRKEFSKIIGKDILLLDSDTFVLDDIEPLFDYLNDYEIVADKTEWGLHGGKLHINEIMITPFNSGVVLFKDNLLQKYGSKIFQMCLDIKHEKNNLGKWYGDYERSNNVSGYLGREEISFTQWIVEENLKYNYFEPYEVQTVKLRCSTKIYHTMTQNWFDGWNQFFRNGKFLPPKKMRRRLFINS